MKKKFRARWLPLILGALLSAYALAALLCAQDRWIYAICAPDVRKSAATDAQGGDTAAAETGLEALVGYLYLSGQMERLEALYRMMNEAKE